MLRNTLKRLLPALAATTAMMGISVSAQAAGDTIKVGVLHSLSGTMAISETTLKDTILMMVDEQNKKGGLLGKYGEATYDFVTGDVKQKTSEFDLNYVIKQFNARVSLFYIDTQFDNTSPDKKQFGLGLQVQL